MIKMVKRGPYTIRYRAQMTATEVAQATMSRRLVRGSILSEKAAERPVSEMTREDLAKMIADINVVCLMLFVK